MLNTLKKNQTCKEVTMQKILEDLEVMLKSIARRALKAENIIDEEVSRSQWGNDKTELVEQELWRITQELDVANKLLNDVKLKEAE